MSLVAFVLVLCAAAQPWVLRDVYAVSGIGDPYCPHGGNYTSSACYYNNLPQYGTYAEFTNNYMWLNPALVTQYGQHVNHTIWSYSGNGCVYWVEEGISQGWYYSNQTVWYYATYNSSTGYSQYNAGATSYNGSNHSYRLEYEGVGGSGTGKYAIVRDGVYLAYFEGLGFGSCMSQGGFELGGTRPDPNYHSDTYDFRSLAWLDTSYGYHYGWNGSAWIDYPCGNGQVPPYCFNGVYYSATHWADNKP